MKEHRLFSKIIEKSVSFEKNKPSTNLERLIEVTGKTFTRTTTGLAVTVGKINLRFPVADETIKIKEIFDAAVATGELNKSKGSGSDLRKFLSDCLE